MSSPAFPPIRACLFDMDGLLINSEDLYSQATNTILNENGRPNLPWNIKAQLQGRPGPAAVAILRNWANLPISHEEFLTRQAALHAELFPSTAPLPGVVTLLQTLKSSPSNVQLAIATSSHRRNFDLKTAHLPDLFSLVPDSQKVLGDDPRIPSGRGKPAPDIWLVALQTINDSLSAQSTGPFTPIRPDECLVLEDSVPGVESGRRAGMRVVWVPHLGLAGEYKGREQDVLAGATGEGNHLIEDPGTVRKDVVGLAGWPSQVGDGWAEQLRTLEDFDYAKYGIRVA